MSNTDNKPGLQILAEMLPAVGGKARKPKAKAKARKAKGKKAAKAKKAKPAAAREGSKKAQVIAMLSTKRGATYAELSKACGWLEKTTRALVAVALKRDMGLKIEMAADAKRGNVMRIK